MSLSRRQFGVVAGTAGLIASFAPALAQSTGRPSRTGPVSDDPFAPLIDDHRKLGALLTRLQTAWADERTDLLQQINSELTGHSVAEENIVYPAMMQIAQGTALARNGYDDHAAVKIVMFQLAGLPKGDEARFRLLAVQLQNSIEAHVREEEQRMFPILRQAYNGQQSRMLGARIDEALLKYG